MTTPTLFFELSLVDPDEEPVWIDQTDQVRSFSTSRGRDRELDRSRAGKASVRVDNRDGRFVPSNTAGAFYPDLRATRGARLSAMIDSGTTAFSMGSSSVGSSDLIGGGGTLLFAIFTGYVEDWPIEWDPSNRDSIAEIDCTDGSLAFSLGTFDFVNTSLLAERTGARISRILEQMGWPYSPDRVDNGTVFVYGQAGGAAEVHSAALDHAQVVTETEGGVLFFDVDDQVVFQDAEHDLGLDPADVYGDAAGEIRYFDIEVTPGADRIWNDVRVQAGSEVGSSISTSSVKRHWRRTLSLSILSGYPEDLLEPLATRRARELRDRYASARTHIRRLVLKPQTSANWIRVLGHEIGDHVLVRKRLPAGDTIEKVSRIEGIEYDSPNLYDWTVTWALSEHVSEPVSLLTPNQRSFETDTSGWAVEANCTIGVSDLAALDGEQSLRMDHTADVASITTSPVTGVGVTAGRTYRMIVGLRSIIDTGGGTFIGGLTSRAHLEIDWYSSVPTLLSTTTGDDKTVARFGSPWQFFELEGIAPGSAVYAVLRIESDSSTPLLPVLLVDAADFYEVG